MKSFMKSVLFSLLLSLVLLSASSALGEDLPAITLDDSGLASWNAIPNAVLYEYQFVDAQFTGTAPMTTTDTFVQVPQGYAVHVHPLLENGDYGDWMISDYFGEATGDPLVIQGNSLAWEMLSSIDPATVQQSGDSLSFVAATPAGSIRFQATGVTYQDGALVFAPGSRLYALDAIGRITSIGVTIADPGNANNQTHISGGYTFTNATSVDDPSSLYTLWGYSTATAGVTGVSECILLDFQPNFIIFGADTTNADAFTLSGLYVCYDETTYNTGVRDMRLLTDFYGTYMEGDTYDASREVFNLDENVLTFYLLVQPDIVDEGEPLVLPEQELDGVDLGKTLTGINDTYYTVGNLKDASGQVLDKSSALSAGCTIEVTIGDYTMDVPLPILSYYTGAQTLHELTPYNNAVSQGEVTALAIPVYWQDQPENATAETLAAIQAALGRVTDANGQVADYSSQLTGRFSLSAYYDAASYGQYAITTFLTDWYAAPYNYIGDKEMQYQLEDEAFITELYDWLMATYPDMDWSRFDGDGDGILDSVIIINAGTSDSLTLYMNTYSYAQFISTGYTGENAGTPQQPALKNYVGMNIDFLQYNTLIHEYAHSFGLIDYYDVTYTGIDAVGQFDMQSAALGDWNAFSKYAVGWIQPQVIEGLSSGESIEVTLRSFAQTGDALVLPAAGTTHDGPFGEYLLLDLFTADGVNCYDVQDYGLDSAAGVRITHVNASMEKRVLTGSDGVEYPIGTVHNTNAYNPEGIYLLKVIQAGGTNTFTDLNNLRTTLTADDLFTPGDSFTTAKYAAFFTNGLMDDGSDLGYQIDIVSLDTVDGVETAVVRITRQ